MAIVYFDSSALVKLVVQEAGSEIAAELWDGADAALTSGLAYPEVRAALAAARREGRITSRGFSDAKDAWEEYWDAIAVVAVTSSILVEAGNAAERFRLRAYDAVHLASAETVPDPHLLVAVWDHRLRDAVRGAGMATAPLEIG